MRDADLIAKVRTLLQSTFSLRFEGELHARKVQAQAYADGYMEALRDAGVVDHQRQLEIIEQERQAFASGHVTRPARSRAFSA